MSCTGCTDPTVLDFPFTFAFQPIVDVRDGSVFSYEALVRGPAGESAASVLERLTPRNRYAFDQACRVRAVALAARLGIACRLNINFMPRAVYEPSACIRTTLEASRHYDFPIERIIFEITEGEHVDDHDHLAAIVREYESLGFTTAFDDFGAGYSGLNFLADFQPSLIKLDMALTRGIDAHYVRQSIVRALVQICADLRITLIAEGIETAAELAWLRYHGIHLIQGYLLARPAFEALPAVDRSVL